jgi:hypothetical protein
MTRAKTLWFRLLVPAILMTGCAFPGRTQTGVAGSAARQDATAAPAPAPAAVRSALRAAAKPLSQNGDRDFDA